MPRTKMPRKKSSVKKKTLSIRISASVESLPSSVSSEPTSERLYELNSVLTNAYGSKADFQNTFQDYYEKKVEAQRKKYEASCEYARNMFRNLLNTYPENFLNSTLASSYNQTFLEDQNNDPNIKASSGHQSRLQKKSEFKKPITPRKDRASRKRSVSVPTVSHVAPQSFRTPLNSAREQMAMCKTITPKVTNTPVSVMRRPQHGEVAFSTSGSPLLIGPVSREDIPTVSVPLQDGRIFSILPDPGLPPPDLPEFDEETKKYLQTLREHLAILAPTSP